MHRTEGQDHDGNLFTDGPPGTRVTASWLNAVQEELAYIIEEAGLTLDTASTETSQQLLGAFQAGTLDLNFNDLDLAGDLVVTGSASSLSLNITNDIVVGGTVDGVDVAALKTDVDGFPDELKNLVTAEIQQLENIGITTISAAQWGYLGGLDQACDTGSAFTCTTLTSNGIDDNATATRLTLGDSEVSMNDSSADIDFRVEGNGEANLLFCDAGNDYVGIGTQNPAGRLNVVGTSSFSSNYFDVYHAGSSYPTISFRKSNSDTLGVLSTTQTEQGLGGLFFQGVDSGNNRDYGALIYAVQDGVAGTTVPARITILTYDDSGGTNSIIFNSSGNFGIGLTPTANMSGLSIEAGVLTLKETTTPTADANYAKIYSKSDNALYYQDGAGNEHKTLSADTGGSLIGLSAIVYRMINTESFGNQDPLGGGGSDWEISDDIENEWYLGSSSQVTESSGTFSFASTGYYFIIAKGDGYCYAAARNLTLSLLSTDDNSTYSTIARANIYDDDSTSYNTSVTIHALIRVDSTSLDKVRLQQGNSAGNGCFIGNGSYNTTYIAFIKLADL